MDGDVMARLTDAPAFREGESGGVHFQLLDKIAMGSLHGVQGFAALAGCF